MFAEWLINIADSSGSINVNFNMKVVSTDNVREILCQSLRL
jgi:hypothetical protein